ncbi:MULTISPECIES: alanine racemase [Basfia]|uniref:Alanine racemase n=2 Tax=Basfia TaxID=697331 RepID=ALR_MANSM|nr:MULTISPECIES: alanine racemase [Basfia]Q65TC1.1 RecName: Full=Alanine racemase [[Mannheimia] succiniciproducens MBEL55E]AAU37789.1 Alr protein [[Mannheimia] succiniciproducens MBEL55E]QIM68538.1 alanine racemase [Basfia succiniciproducens]SCX76082.1 alanine racemase [Basfia succiniciproducens]SEP89294.1 alanine racemase [Basfia succiniciproducens]
MKPATVKISSVALKHNIQIIKQKAPHSKIIAVVKANAYGHGVEFVSSTLENLVDGFGVARLAEALSVRSNGVTKPILLLEGFFSPKDLPILSVNNIQTVVHNQDQLDAIKRANLENPIKVWLKIDTGMHRLGVSLEEVDYYYNELMNCPNVDEVGFVSHFSRADETDSDYTNIQLNRFLDATKNKKGNRTIAASGGILFWEDSHLEYIRPGIIMYGVSPINIPSSEYGLIPVMTLTSSLIAVRDHKKGEPVGYGGIWVSERDTKIGVVAIGYGDGYPRNVPAGTPIYINGRRVPIVGRVSMDMVTVDLGPDCKDKVGDEAVLWGKELPIEEVAEITGLLSYELMTKLTPRVLTEYVD